MRLLIAAGDFLEHWLVLRSLYYYYYSKHIQSSRKVPCYSHPDYATVVKIIHSQDSGPKIIMQG